jgi:hypothetical protein
MLEINTDKLHHLNFIFILEEKLPQQAFSPTSSPPQHSSKKDELELHQIFYTIFYPSPVFHSSSVSSSPP